MNCKECHKKLMDYLEGSLSGPEVHQVEYHLQECPSCRDFAAFVEESLASVAGLRLTEPDPFFYTRVKARLERQEGARQVLPRFARVLQPAVLSLLIGVAVIAGIGIGNYPMADEHDRFVVESLDPWMNELGSEPMETFLMD